MLKNFYQELAAGRRKFKDVLMKKYGNILQCESNFKEMTESVQKVEVNVQTLHTEL